MCMNKPKTLWIFYCCSCNTHPRNKQTTQDRLSLSNPEPQNVLHTSLADILSLPQDTDVPAVDASLADIFSLLQDTDVIAFDLPLAFRFDLTRRGKARARSSNQRPQVPSSHHIESSGVDSTRRSFPDLSLSLSLSLSSFIPPDYHHHQRQSSLNGYLSPGDPSKSRTTG